MSPAPTTEARNSLRDYPRGRRPVMFQRWERLLFLHWEVAPERIEETLPDSLTVDTFGGKAYVGLVPFFMRGIRPRRLPALPGISNFLEVNVRTYVCDEEGRPGVWFYSLDANRRLAVSIARRFFALPYHFAKMSAQVEGDRVDYRSQRHAQGVAQPTRFTYHPAGPVREAEPGSLDFFLVERYLLFSLRPDGRLASGRVHHKPYPIQPAEVPEWDTSLLALAGLPEPNGPPDHTCYSAGVSVDVFGLQSRPI